MPGIKSFIKVEFEFALAIVALFGPPLNCVQTPVPVVGATAVKLVEVARQSCWSLPARAGLAPAKIVMATLEELEQLPLVMVHLKT